MNEYGIHEGWYELVEPLISFVEENGGTVLDVKEKFGGLRFYYSEPENYDEDVWNDFERMVNQAEQDSLVTCEYTGKSGKIRKINGWLKCVCDEVYEELTSVKKEFEGR